MNLPQWMTESLYVQRIGWVLLQSLWQGAAIAALLAVMLAMLRSRGPRVRYTLCCLAMAALAIAPLATFFINIGSTARTPSPSMPPHVSTLIVEREAALPAATFPRADSAVSTGLNIFPSSPTLAIPQLAKAPLSQRVLAILSSWIPWLVPLWVIGVLALSLWNLITWCLVQRLASSHTLPVDAALQQLALRLASRLGLTHLVRLAQSPAVNSPVVIGMFKPLILFPISILTELPFAQLEALIAHELAHVLRHDYLVNLLQIATETLLFYHPATWWISSRIRAEREHCCDDLAISVTQDRTAYVCALAHVAGVRMPSLTPAASGGVLLPRLRRVLGMSTTPADNSSRSLAGVVVSVLCLIGVVVIGSRMRTSAVHAAIPAVEAPVDAASLVREVRASEAWVDTVKSLRLKAMIGGRAARNVAPVAELTKPETHVLAFDEHRLYLRTLAQEYHLDRHYTWDGKILIGHDKYSPKENNQELYSFGARIERTFSGLFSSLSWPRTGPHSYWWLDKEELDRPDREDWFGGKPEDFRIASREKFNGIDCFAVESDMHYITLYIGAKDHRLYGRTDRSLTNEAFEDHRNVNWSIAREMGGKVNSESELGPWLTSLSSKMKEHYSKESSKRMRPFTLPQFTHWYSDYKEVAPACWLPMHQAYTMWHDREATTSDLAATTTRDIQITEVSVNELLPDAMFEWQFTEGVDTLDLRTDPHLTYKYKKHFEPAEWQAILEEGNERKIQRRPVDPVSSDRTRYFKMMEMELARSRAIHAAPSDFPPNATWINSAPLKLAGLKGKVVLLYFWTSESKLCRADIPKLNDLHEKEKDKIAVVSVHTGLSPDQVRKAVLENGVKFPVIVDGPPAKGPEQTSWDGPMFTAYGLSRVPEAFVIDRQGKFVARANPETAIELAREAITRPAPAPASRPVEGKDNR